MLSQLKYGKMFADVDENQFHLGFCGVQSCIAVLQRRLSIIVQQQHVECTAHQLKCVEFLQVV